MALDIKILNVPMTFGRFDFFSLMDAPITPATQNADVLKFEAPKSLNAGLGLMDEELRPAA